GTSGSSSVTPAALSCNSATMTGAGTDACTVSLSGAAGTGGLAVSLSNNNSAVTVPASVTVPAGATSAGFTANISAVSSTQTAVLTATAGGVAKTFGITLNAVTAALTLGSNSIAFGNVDLNTPATQSVTLTSSGTAALTISAGSVTGAGFSISGLSLPVTLNPGQTATLYVQFDPTTAGAATGAVTLSSNATPGTATISLSGTGQTTSYQVDLAWSAPTNSADPVAGYHIYRTTSGSSSYQLLNTSVDASTTYIDTTVQNGTSYSYYVKSVDSSGTESLPSNIFSVNIP
ncbi:MAG TPA: choice-of-anchor D domain-containing protein, partial [Terracidiphilus sp.]